MNQLTPKLPPFPGRNGGTEATNMQPINLGAAATALRSDRRSLSQLSM